MTNKLSELSNPAWIVGQQEIADFMRGDEALLVRGYDPESTEPALRMYSQEYVSDLLEELEAKDKRIAELEQRLATPVRLPRPACTYADHSYPAYSRKQVEEIITSAGMRFTVEGDEQ
ncbi:TPA: hypothetical protein ACGD8A_001157 [Serratia marcescens]|uniref:Ead/Ea22-like family protein n=1 Tax=Serratia marcescens SM39 TaxID=1334564 RepID=A0AAT9EFZ1_SERMA|nr:hypothetical protein [Serratia marcescens]BAO32586.1 hypothetical protein SM39_0524 [Serratia marcescens SM39]BCZ39790.1 hypothetical protein SMGES_11160 [Serratia marcescens]HBI6266473.1 hypothetical protein [Serratia marcescens]HBI6947638.1 hypothetical protein [Serratia marcescens]